MTSDRFPNFVDGSDVDIEIHLHEKVVVLVAFDEKTRKRYRLTFRGCSLIVVDYSDDDEPDLYSLTDGIWEIGGKAAHRTFMVHFADESIMKIACKDVDVTEL